MNFTPLMANSSVFATLDEEEDLLSDFFGNQASLIDVSNCIDFHPEVYDYREEAFNMQQLLSSEDLVGGVSPNPTFPNILSLDLQGPLSRLEMYTNNLTELAAPRELCVQKALELIRSRSGYELNLEAFRMDLLADVLADDGRKEVNALIAGVRAICDYLLANFDNHLSLHADLFPYEFYCLHNNRYLFMSKIVLDANIPAFRPATVPLPAYTYPEVYPKVRADYIASPDKCLIL